MARTRRHILLAIVTLLHAAAAAVSPADLPARLRDDAAAFVPACAAPCLASFLAVNYARGDASDQFLDLDFVCAYRGRSGYTVSEGAVQCIAGERNVGFCTKAESGDDALLKATTVCDGAKDAAEPRGGVITATLRYGPTSGILTFAPITTSESAIPVPTSPKSSSTSTSTSTSTKTTLTTATPTTSKTTSQTTTITTTTTGTSITTTSATPSPTDNVAGDQPSLSKGQIAGISVGAVCIAGGLVLAAVLLTRCLLRRRRRQRHRNSSSSSFGPNGPGPTGGSYHTPTRDTWGYRFDKSSHSNSPAPADLLRYPAMSGAAAAADHPAKELYNRASWRPSAIGLAISPSKLFRSSPTNTPTRTRPLSKLLPAKPDMQQSPPPRPTYQESHGDQVPQQQYPIAAQFMRTVAPSLRVVIPDTKLSLLPAVAAAGRDSTLTEFEEDDLRRSTSSTAAGQIWCPPLSASAPPESAVAAYYVADGRGNWILGDPRSPLSAGSAPRIATATAGIVTTAVQTHIPAPRKSPSHNTAAPASPQELAATPLPEAKTTRKGDSQQRPASPPRMAPITRTPKTVPSPLFSRLSNPRSVSQPVPSHNQPAGRSLTARPAQPRVTSTDSGITTFSISTAVSESPVAQQSSVPTGRARTLSPVAESPGHRTPPPPLPTAVSTNSSSSSSPGRSSKVFTDPPPGTSESSSGGGGGVSPVSYPRIHGRDRVLTPGVAPSRAASHAETTHRGPSPAAVPRQPTYGGPDPRGGRGVGRGGMPSPAMQRLRPTAHIAHAARTGSPTMRIVEPSPEPPHPTAASPSPRDDRTLLPSSSVVGAPSRPPRRRPPSNLPHPFPLYPVPRAHRRSAARAEPTQPIDDDGFSRYPMPMPRPYRPQDREERAPQHVAYDPAAHDNSSQEALATSPSSLLTKRLGSTRAADMALAPKELQRRDHWKQQEEQQQKKKQGGDGKTQVPGGLGTPELPSTPNWLPRLTPTRRGEDLVLNVG